MSETTVIALPQQVQQDSSAIVKHANELSIVTPADYRSAADTLRQIKTVRGRIAETFDGAIEQAHKAHKAMLDAKKRHEAPLIEAENTIKRKASAWQAEQELIRQAEEARLREVARKGAEDLRLREAEELERSGDSETAAAVIAAPVATPVIVAPKVVPKVAGVSTRKAWKFRIVNADLIPRQYMIPNEKALGSLAKSLGAAASVPGVEFYAEDVMAVAGL